MIYNAIVSNNSILLIIMIISFLVQLSGGLTKPRAFVTTVASFLSGIFGAVYIVLSSNWGDKYRTAVIIMSVLEIISLVVAVVGIFISGYYLAIFRIAPCYISMIFAGALSEYFIRDDLDDREWSSIRDPVYTDEYGNKGHLTETSINGEYKEYKDSFGRTVYKDNNTGHYYKQNGNYNNYSDITGSVDD